MERSSVEVFTETASLTALIFAEPGSRRSSLHAAGGTAQLVEITVYGMRSIWEIPPP